MKALLALRDRLSTALIDAGDLSPTHDLHRFLLDHQASSLEHAGGRNLLDHLQGTERILCAWKQPEFVCRAGLFHSVYSTQQYRTALLDGSNRNAVRAQIGTRAEALVYTFSRLDRPTFFADLPRLWEGNSSPITVPTIDGGQSHPRSEVLHLVTVLLANEIDQVSGPQGEPARWLARWSGVDQTIKASLDGQSVPWPLFSTAVSSTQEQDLIRRYKEAIALWQHQSRASLASFEECVTLCPWLAEPHIWLAVLFAEERNFEQSQRCAAQARTIFEQTGLCWDKRLDHAAWLALAQDLERSQTPPHSVLERATTQLTVGFILRPAIIRETANLVDPVPGSPDITASCRFATYIATPKPRNSPEAYPGLSADAVYDNSLFPLTRDLELSFPLIRDEIRSLEDRLFNRESERIQRTGDWDVFFFSERGRLNVDNCLRCPTIATLMLRHNTVRSTAGLIYVSKLRPGTRIAEHRGPTNVRLRCHLGIDIPEGDCGIQVGDQTLRWQAGSALVFNDAIAHHAWNNTAKDRTVLIMDLWHPDLSPSEIALLRAFDHQVQFQAGNLVRYRQANQKSAESRRSGYD